MPDNFNFELVSPERMLLSELVIDVVIPASEGEMTVMAHHAPTMAAIKPGIIKVHSASGRTQDYVVSGGFADVLPTGCTVLAESAVPIEELSQDELARRLNIAN